MVPRRGGVVGSAGRRSARPLRRSYILAAVVLVALIADPYLERTQARFGEFYGLLLWSSLGAMVMAKADHLLVVFVGLELLSVALYVLNAFHRTSGVSLEAGWKYLVVGAFAACLLLFGIALLYGATGTFRSPPRGAGRCGRSRGNTLLIAGFALILAGLAFKLALAPFTPGPRTSIRGRPLR